VKRRAIVQLSQQDLERLLQLPDGMTIVGVRDDWARFGVRVLIEGGFLDEVPEEVEPPVLHGTWTRNLVTLRYEWRRDMSPEKA
jgi:hypothetical protein